MLVEFQKNELINSETLSAQILSWKFTILISLYKNKVVFTFKYIYLYE